MWKSSGERTCVRFGEFQLDLEAGQLRKGGIRVPLQREPCQLLSALVKEAGKVVKRSELHSLLWSTSTNVEFDHCLNTAINKLRKALSDSAQGPQFIETVHGVGYRFIARPEWSAATPSQLLLAVLPFSCWSQNPDQERLCAGLTEELISQFGQAHPRLLSVIARTSSGLYKESQKSVAEIAQELGISLILEGSVRREKKRVRVSARLIDSIDQTQIWAGSYDEELGSMLSLEIEIAQMIVKEVCKTLGFSASQSKPLISPRSPKAREAYLKGRYHLQKLTEDSLLKAVGLFEQAFREDANFTLAYAGLAESCNLLRFVGVPSKELVSRAKSAVLKAIELDKELAAAHNALAGVLFFYEWDWTRAETAFRTSLKLNTSLSEGHQNYAILLSVLGRHEEALREAKAGLRLDPVSLLANTNLAWRLYRARHYQDAMDQAKEVLLLEPTFPNAMWCLGKSQIQLGAYENGKSTLEQAVKLSPRNLLFRADLITAYALTGEHEKAHDYLASLNGQRTNSYESQCALAVAYCALGDEEKALEWLHRAYEQGDPYLIWIREDVSLKPLRSRLKFERLVQKMDFPNTNS